MTAEATSTAEWQLCLCPVQAVPDLVASLSHGRPSAGDEYSSEAAAGGAAPGGRRDAPDGSPWEAKSPGDSPRSRIPGPLGSLTGEQRQAGLRHMPSTAACLVVWTMMTLA